MNPRIETIDVQGSPMEVFLFEPSGRGPHPGLVLCQHIPGGHSGIENDVFTLKTAQRYAQNGYFVAAPFIFHWWPKSEEMLVKARAFRDDWTALDLAASYALLAAQPAVAQEGRVAWLGACTHPGYKACALFYAGRVKLPLGPAGTPAAIELAQQIRCPVIGFFGNDDNNPTPEDVNDYAAALQKAGVEHTFHRYDGAGHAFQSFDSEERYRPQASEDAWTRVLEFLAEKLR